MASVGEGDCHKDPNFAVVCSFLDKYGASLGLEPISYSDLQKFLEDTTGDVSRVLIDIHVRLLRRIGKSIVNSDRFEKCIIKFCHHFSEFDAWEVESYGYKHAQLATKLRILKNLLECQFDYNLKFKEKINGQSAEDMRFVPIGRDKEGQAYWYFLDHDFNLLVYKEEQDDEDADTWKLVCSNRHELARLVNSLQNKDEDKSSTGESRSSKEGSPDNDVTVGSVQVKKENMVEGAVKEEKTAQEQIVDDVKEEKAVKEQVADDVKEEKMISEEAVNIVNDKKLKKVKTVKDKVLKEEKETREKNIDVIKEIKTTPDEEAKTAQEQVVKKQKITNSKKKKVRKCGTNILPKLETAKPSLSSGQEKVSDEYLSISGCEDKVTDKTNTEKIKDNPCAIYTLSNRVSLCEKKPKELKNTASERERNESEEDNIDDTKEAVSSKVDTCEKMYVSETLECESLSSSKLASGKSFHNDSKLIETQEQSPEDAMVEQTQVSSDPELKQREEEAAATPGLEITHTQEKETHGGLVVEIKRSVETKQIEANVTSVVEVNQEEETKVESSFEKVNQSEETNVTCDVKVNEAKVEEITNAEVNQAELTKITYVQEVNQREEIQFASAVEMNQAELKVKLDVEVNKDEEAKVTFDVEVNQAKVTKITSDVEVNQGEVTKITSDVEVNQGEVTKITSDVEVNLGEVTKVTSDVEVNLGEVTKITSDVEVNLGEITKVTSDVEVNQGEVTKVTSDVEGNQDEVTKITSDVEVNQGEVTKVTSDVEVNQGEVTKVTSDVELNQGEVTKITSDVEVNQGEVTKITSDVEVNQGEVTKITSDVEVNQGEVTKITSDVEVNQGEETVVTSDVEVNQGEAAKVTSNVDVNQGEVTKITSDVELNRGEVAKVTSDEVNRGEETMVTSDVEVNPGEAAKVTSDVEVNQGEVAKVTSNFEMDRGEAAKVTTEVNQIVVAKVTSVEMNQVEEAKITTEVNQIVVAKVTSDVEGNQAEVTKSMPEVNQELAGEVTPDNEVKKGEEAKVTSNVEVNKNEEAEVTPDVAMNQGEETEVTSDVEVNKDEEANVTSDVEVRQRVESEVTNEEMKNRIVIPSEETQKQPTVLNADSECYHEKDNTTVHDSNRSTITSSSLQVANSGPMECGEGLDSAHKNQQLESETPEAERNKNELTSADVCKTEENCSKSILPSHVPKFDDSNDVSAVGAAEEFPESPPDKCKKPTDREKEPVSELGQGACHPDKKNVEVCPVSNRNSDEKSMTYQQEKLATEHSSIKAAVDEKHDDASDSLATQSTQECKDETHIKEKQQVEVNESSKGSHKLECLSEMKNQSEPLNNTLAKSDSNAKEKNVMEHFCEESALNESKKTGSDHESEREISPRKEEIINESVSSEKTESKEENINKDSQNNTQIFNGHTENDKHLSINTTETSAVETTLTKKLLKSGGKKPGKHNVKNDENGFFSQENKIMPSVNDEVLNTSENCTENETPKSQVRSRRKLKRSVPEPGSDEPVDSEPNGKRAKQATRTQKTRSGRNAAAWGIAVRLANKDTESDDSETPLSQVRRKGQSLARGSGRRQTRSCTNQLKQANTQQKPVVDGEGEDAGNGKRGKKKKPDSSSEAVSEEEATPAKKGRNQTQPAGASKNKNSSKSGGAVGKKPVVNTMSPAVEEDTSGIRRSLRVRTLRARRPPTPSSPSEETEETSEDDLSSEEEEDHDKNFLDASFTPEEESGDEEFRPKGRNFQRQAARTCKEETEEVVNDDTPCVKCGKYDHPEMILLCDKCDAGYHTACLRPPLMLIPDGDWFCPPCEHSKLVEKLLDCLQSFDLSMKKRDRLSKRQERLAFVGINITNILHGDRKVTPSARFENQIKQFPDKEAGQDGEEIDGKGDSRKQEESASTSSYESEAEPKRVYKSERLSIRQAQKRSVRERHKHRRNRHKRSPEVEVLSQRTCRTRAAVSYQFKEFDELISSAIEDDKPCRREKPPGINRGKDMSNILGASDEEDEKIRQRDGSYGEPPPVVKKKCRRRLTRLDSDDDPDEDESDEFQISDAVDSEATEGEDDAEDEDLGSSESGDWKPQKTWYNSHASSRRPGRRKQNFVVDDDDYNSDENASKRRSTRNSTRGRIHYNDWDETEKEASFSDESSEYSLYAGRKSQKLKASKSRKKFTSGKKQSININTDSDSSITIKRKNLRRIIKKRRKDESESEDTEKEAEDVKDVQKKQKQGKVDSEESEFVLDDEGSPEDSDDSPKFKKKNVLRSSDDEEKEDQHVVDNVDVKPVIEPPKVGSITDCCTVQLETLSLPADMLETLKEDAAKGKPKATAKGKKRNDRHAEDKVSVPVTDVVVPGKVRKVSSSDKEPDAVSEVKSAPPIPRISAPGDEKKKQAVFRQRRKSKDSQDLGMSMLDQKAVPESEEKDCDVPQLPEKATTGGKKKTVPNFLDVNSGEESDEQKQDPHTDSTISSYTADVADVKYTVQSQTSDGVQTRVDQLEGHPHQRNFYPSQHYQFSAGSYKHSAQGMPPYSQHQGVNSSQNIGQGGNESGPHSHNSNMPNAVAHNGPPGLVRGFSDPMSHHSNTGPANTGGPGLSHHSNAGPANTGGPGLSHHSNTGPANTGGPGLSHHSNTGPANTGGPGLSHHSNTGPANTGGPGLRAPHSFIGRGQRPSSGYPFPQGVGHSPQSMEPGQNVAQDHRMSHPGLQGIPVSHRTPPGPVGRQMRPGMAQQHHGGMRPGFFIGQQHAHPNMESDSNPEMGGYIPQNYGARRMPSPQDLSTGAIRNPYYGMQSSPPHGMGQHIRQYPVSMGSGPHNMSSPLSSMGQMARNLGSGSSMHSPPKTLTPGSGEGSKEQQSGVGSFPNQEIVHRQEKINELIDLKTEINEDDSPGKRAGKVGKKRAASASSKKKTPELNAVPNSLGPVKQEPNATPNHEGSERVSEPGQVIGGYRAAGQPYHMPPYQMPYSHGTATNINPQQGIQSPYMNPRLTSPVPAQLGPNADGNNVLSKDSEGKWKRRDSMDEQSSSVPGMSPAEQRLNMSSYQQNLHKSHPKGQTVSPLERRNSMSPILQSPGMTAVDHSLEPPSSKHSMRSQETAMEQKPRIQSLPPPTHTSDISQNCSGRPMAQGQAMTSGSQDHNMHASSHGQNLPLYSQGSNVGAKISEAPGSYYNTGSYYSHYGPHPRQSMPQQHTAAWNTEMQGYRSRFGPPHGYPYAMNQANVGNRMPPIQPVYGSQGHSVTDIAEVPNKGSTASQDSNTTDDTVKMATIGEQGSVINRRPSTSEYHVAKTVESGHLYPNKMESDIKPVIRHSDSGTEGENLVSAETQRSRSETVTSLSASVPATSAPAPATMVPHLSDVTTAAPASKQSGEQSSFQHSAHSNMNQPRHASPVTSMAPHSTWPRASSVQYSHQHMGQWTNMGGPGHYSLARPYGGPGAMAHPPYGIEPQPGQMRPNFSHMDQKPFMHQSYESRFQSSHPGMAPDSEYHRSGYNQDYPPPGRYPPQRGQDCSSHLGGHTSDAGDQITEGSTVSKPKRAKTQKKTGKDGAGSLRGKSGKGRGRGRGGFMIDNLLRVRGVEGEEEQGEDSTEMNDIVSYVTTDEYFKQQTSTGGFSRQAEMGFGGKKLT